MKAGSLFAAVVADGTTPGGLYRSDDAGSTWTRVTVSAGVDQVNHVHIHSLRSGFGIYISTGRGRRPGRWRRVVAFERRRRHLDARLRLATRIPTAARPDDPDQLIAILNPSAALGNINPGTYLSLDLGCHWTKINTGLAEPDLVVDAIFDQDPSPR